MQTIATKEVYFPHFWRLEVQDQVPTWSGSGEVFSHVIGGWLLVSSHGR
jgi:hypothetical protein